MKVIGVTDTKGRRKEYRVKPLDDLTVREWLVIDAPFPEEETDGFEKLLQLVMRHTTLPRKVLEQMPARDVKTMMDAMAVLLHESRKAKDAAEQAEPKSFTFKGVKYMVPQEIEKDMTFGQWESLDKVLLPKCKSDAEGYTAILAVCCWPAGEEFDGGKINEKMELFMDLPVRTAFEVCAFFFGSSEQLWGSINRIVKRSVGLLKASGEPV